MSHWHSAVRISPARVAVAQVFVRAGACACAWFSKFFLKSCVPNITKRVSDSHFDILSIIMNQISSRFDSGLKPRENARAPLQNATMRTRDSRNAKRNNAYPRFESRIGPRENARAPIKHKASWKSLGSWYDVGPRDWETSGCYCLSRECIYSASKRYCFLFRLRSYVVRFVPPMWAQLRKAQ